MRRILPLLLLAGCPAGDDDDSGAGIGEFALTIASPSNGAAVTAGVDGDLSLAIVFAADGLTLAAPGTCPAAARPCGSVAVRIDGTACDDPQLSWNANAWASPARARLRLCAVPAGTHRVRLELLADDGTPLIGAGGVGIGAEIDVTVTIPSLYERLGGDGGIAAAVASHTTAMLGSGKVNAWLRNNSVDLARMNECTASWIGAQAGGPSYDPTCRPLLEAHAGKGLATRDFTAWTDLLATVLTARGTAQRDIDELVALIAPTSQDVVEDPDGAATLFQRLGGRPGVWAIIEDFSTKLIWNPEIAGFFTGPDGAPVYSLRTATCLLRLVGSVDGPFRYGEELGREPNVTGTACRDMVTAHTNMTAPPQQADGKKVGAREFSEVARMLMCTMADHDVSQADIDLTLSVLAPMCGDITAPGTDCGEVFVEPVCP